tara:strand:+ start:195 stop:380 length:186 start_codon:yes stop_codon:yes gene_type:complete
MIKQALISKLEGEVAMHRADLRKFFTSQTGVAEHIDFVATAEKKLESLTTAEDKLERLKTL